MKVFSKEYLKRVSSRLFSSAGEMATNKGHSFNLKYVTDELKVIGAIGAAIFVLSKIEIDSLKTSVNQISQINYNSQNLGLFHTMYRHNGFYSPVFNDIQLFKSSGLTYSYDNYKFDTYE
jgi:trimethylamine:corrinoid methyltransferase-like protein